MYLERYILPVSNTLSRSFSVPLFSQFLSQIEIVAMGMRIHSVSRIISDLSLLILPDSSRFVVSRCDTTDFNPSRTDLVSSDRNERMKERRKEEEQWRNPGGEGRSMRKETQSFAIPRRTAFKLYEGIY